MHWYADAFEEQRVEVLHAVAEGDLVALHVELSARHTGYFRGVAPTGRRFRVREMHVLRFAEGARPSTGACATSRRSCGRSLTRRPSASAERPVRRGTGAGVVRPARYARSTVPCPSTRVPA